MDNHLGGVVLPPSLLQGYMPTVGPRHHRPRHRHRSQQCIGIVTRVYIVSTPAPSPPTSSDSPIHVIHSYLASYFITNTDHIPYIAMDTHPGRVVLLWSPPSGTHIVHCSTLPPPPLDAIIHLNNLGDAETALHVYFFIGNPSLLSPG
jgi:hypothetical protein